MIGRPAAEADNAAQTEALVALALTARRRRIPPSIGLRQTAAFNGRRRGLERRPQRLRNQAIVVWSASGSGVGAMSSRFCAFVLSTMKGWVNS